MEDTARNVTGGSHKLIRCLGVNGEGHASTRYVEIECFRLWRYLMSERHGFEITDIALCLWLDAGTFERQAEVFARAGEVSPVTRLEAIIYDDCHHFDLVVNRFVPSEDARRMRGVIESHVPDDIISGDRFELLSYPGMAVERNQPLDLNHFVLGLSNDFE